MPRKGKASSIRYRSNNNFDYYTNSGNVDISKLNKRERKRYLKKKKAEALIIEESARECNYRKKVDGKWVIIKTKKQ